MESWNTNRELFLPSISLQRLWINFIEHSPFCVPCKKLEASLKKYFEVCFSNWQNELWLQPGYSHGREPSLSSWDFPFFQTYVNMSGIGQVSTMKHGSHLRAFTSSGFKLPWIWVKKWEWESVNMYFNVSLLQPPQKAFLNIYSSLDAITITMTI